MVEELVRTTEAQDRSVVINRHPLCTTPEVSWSLSKLVTEGRVNEIYSSIHAIIPKAHARFVCCQTGDFAVQFFAVKSILTPEELHKFWFLLWKRYAIDFRDREKAAASIEAPVIEHLRSKGLYKPSA